MIPHRPRSLLSLISCPHESLLALAKRADDSDIRLEL
jgi:hypothetical protein